MTPSWRVCFARRVAAPVRASRAGDLQESQDGSTRVPLAGRHDLMMRIDDSEHAIVERDPWSRDAEVDRDRSPAVASEVMCRIKPSFGPVLECARVIG